jgi:hypothetical protein
MWSNNNTYLPGEGGGREDIIEPQKPEPGTSLHKNFQSHLQRINEYSSHKHHKYSMREIK